MAVVVAVAIAVAVVAISIRIAVAVVTVAVAAVVEVCSDRTLCYTALCSHWSHSYLTPSCFDFI